MRWTVEEVARGLGVEPPSGLDPLARLAGVSIDSRTVARGELFIAIHGPRHDGHNFIRAALDAGALAAVVAQARQHEFPAAVRGRLFGVADTLAALQELARAVRTRWGGRLAAVTGSAGKTTTKEILAALLAARFRVLKSAGNLNNEFGLPLQLLRLENEDQAAVVELGMSHAGELRRLAEIALPDVGVVTCVAPVHLEFFASIDEIAQAKRELIEGLRDAAQSVAVLNADDARVSKFASIARGRVLTFGFSPAADFRAENIHDRGMEGSEFVFISPAGRARLALPLAGRHNIANALAALAAASVWSIGGAEAREVFPRLQPAGMRGRILRYESGFSVIDDCYNSNPAALDAMIDLLVHTPAPTPAPTPSRTPIRTPIRTPVNARRILAAGEMLELGPASPELHRQSGSYAAAMGQIDWIVGVQGDAAQLIRGARESGFPEKHTRFFPSAAEAGEFLAGLVEPGDLLLVKGSRCVHMERVIEALDARFPRANAPAEEEILHAVRKEQT